MRAQLGAAIARAAAAYSSRRVYRGMPPARHVGRLGRLGPGVAARRDDHRPRVAKQRLGMTGALGMADREAHVGEEPGARGARDQPLGARYGSAGTRRRRRSQSARRARALRRSAGQGWSRAEVDQKPSTNLASSDISSGDHGRRQASSVRPRRRPPCSRTTSLDVLLDLGSGRAAHRGERIGDRDRVGLHLHVVHQPQVDDVHPELGILDRAQRLEHVFVR